MLEFWNNGVMGLANQNEHNYIDFSQQWHISRGKSRKLMSDGHHLNYRIIETLDMD
jgi:hypothetical protein